MSVEYAKNIIRENTYVLYGIFGVIDSSGFFPPMELLNQFLMLGSDPCDQDGRMDSWIPFKLKINEYEMLKEWWMTGHPGDVVDAFGKEDWSEWTVEIIERI